MREKTPNQSNENESRITPLDSYGGSILMASPLKVEKTHFIEYDKDRQTRIEKEDEVKKLLYIMPKIIAGGMQLSEYEMTKLKELENKHKISKKI